MADIRAMGPTGRPIDLQATEAGALNITGEVDAAGKVYRTRLVEVPGIGASAAYQAADAFGTVFSFDVPTTGVILNAVFLDRDDEGIEKNLVLFSAKPTATADNAAFALTDNDIASVVGVVAITTFYDFANNQIGMATPALGFVAPEGKLWCQIVTQGADNIAASAMPQVFLVVGQ